MSHVNWTLRHYLSIPSDDPGRNWSQRVLDRLILEAKASMTTVEKAWGRRREEMLRLGFSEEQMRFMSSDFVVGFMEGVWSVGEVGPGATDEDVVLRFGELFGECVSFAEKFVPGSEIARRFANAVDAES